MGLRTKFIVSLVIVTAGLSIASLLMVRDRVGRHVYDELVVSLQNSAATFQQVQRGKDTSAQRTVQLVANIPALKAMMTTGDPATIQDASGDIWRRAGTDLLAIAGPDGRLMALHNTGTALQTDAVATVLARSLTPFRGQDWWYLDGRLYEVFLEPVSAGSQGNATSLGVVAIGFAIDRDVAQQAASIADGLVAFRYGGHIVVSTLSGPQANDLDRSALPAGAEGGAAKVELGGENYVATAVSLGQAPVEVVMLKSYDRATSFLGTLNRLSIVIAFMAVVLGSVLVFFISHTFTRPLAELVTGVRALGKGNFNYPLPLKGTDEVAEVTRAFDTMRHSLQESQSRMVNAARMEAVGQLAGGVAHDFNNLVTIIKGYTELLRMHAPPGDQIAGYIQQIQKAGDRAASVTRQLLAFSRRQVVQQQVIDLGNVVGNMAKMLRVLIGEDIQVKLIAESDLRRVLADPGQVEQVVMNLGVNARDAMPKGGTLTIETTNADVDRTDLPQGVSGVQPGRFVRVSVTDTGTGMTPEILDKVFQPFFTTKETGKGTGLGLAIVFGIVKQCGGFVKVHSEPGKGSTFEVYFPETLQKPDLLMMAAPAWKLDARAQGKVLVVEDEEALRGIARDSLRLQGYTVFEAANGAEGLSVFERTGGTVDMVRTDIVMPQLSGLDMVEQMRKRRPELKVLFMSGYTDRMDEITNAGLDFLPKPFTPEELLRAVRSLAQPTVT